MSDWRLAGSLIKLREQIDELFPNRSKVSDGSVGDLSHQQRKSDHNPNSHGVVQAIDVTNDPRGPTGDWLSQSLFNSKDPRIKYIIFNRRITTTDKKGWKDYHGANAHTHHVHISVANDPKLYDSDAEWVLSQGPPLPKPVEPVTEVRDLKRGMTGDDVAVLQRKLVMLGYLKTSVYGNFLSKTETAVKVFQKSHKLKQDGIVGPKTREALGL